MPTNEEYLRAVAADWQIDRFIESRARFFERENANLRAKQDGDQARARKRAKEAELAAAWEAYYRDAAARHLQLAREARRKARRLRASERR